MLFVQAAAPVGWTRVLANDDSLLRINGSTTPSAGGSNGFVATFNSQTATGSTTLTTAQLPAQTYVFHFHPGTNSAGSTAGPYPAGGDGSGACAIPLMSTTATSTSSGTVVTDSNAGGSHNHSITTSIKYVDALVATKN
jgi:hypothetical protein